MKTNALGSGNLKEIAVLLPPNAVDIDQIIESLKSRPFNNTNMKKLEEEHRQFYARNPPKSANKEKVDFLEWYSFPARPVWKLGWWDSYGQASKKAKDLVLRDYNKNEPYDFIACRKNDYRISDWILCFRLTAKDFSNLGWIYVEKIVKVDRSDKKAYDGDFPYQAVQPLTPKHYTQPPFAITPEFRGAFKAAIRKIGVEAIKMGRSVQPTAQLVKMIRKEM